MASVEVRTSTVIWELGEGGWDGRRDVDPAAIRQAIDAGRPVWVDIEGSRQDVEASLAEVAAGSSALEGIDPGRAAHGGESPPESPPKAKAFRRSVFGRAYWLGIGEEMRGGELRDVLVAQEVHVIAGSTFAITTRFRPVAWDIEGEQLEPRPYAGDGATLELSGVRTGFLELGERLAGAGDEMVFGLQVTASLLDHVVDSLFDSLNALRRRADSLEETALQGDWLWEKRSKLERKMLGLGRLLRQVRWAFMPSDEIDEFLSGPFINVRDVSKGIAHRFEDLQREAERAVDAAKDVTDQAHHAVELIHTMKADRLNNTMYVLTVVATVLLVPTLIAGIYGMNFRHMPELGWRTGYAMALGLMAVLCLGAWWWIKTSLRRR